MGAFATIDMTDKGLNRDGIAAVGFDFVEDGEFGDVGDGKVGFFIVGTKSESCMGELNHKLFKL